MLHHFGHLRAAGRGRFVGVSVVGLTLLGWLVDVSGADAVRDLQQAAITEKASKFGHWGADKATYMGWKSHSNRLIPVYTFGTLGQGYGVDFTSYTGPHSPYRSERKIRALYGRLPEGTLNTAAEYCDQTNLHDLQAAAARAGKKHIFLVIFDGMDWQTTRCAAIHATQGVNYASGRGTGLHFLDYTAQGTSQFGWMVTSPHNEGTDADVNTQTVKNPGGKILGGYAPTVAGFYPWSAATDPGYLISKPGEGVLQHAYTDSSCSASNMTAGIKSYNNSVNVDPQGQPFDTLPLKLQRDGWLIGAVTSVPISHATPAAVGAHNVHRDDYQDLTRDLLGLRSISHPKEALPGLDVLIGGGYGVDVTNVDDIKKQQGVEAQGDNFVPGNRFLTAEDLQAIDVAHGGRYVTAVRTADQSGAALLQQAAEKAAKNQQRLFGFFGNGAYGHLPFATADGDFQPVLDNNEKAEKYTPADLTENPTLAEMTRAALTAITRPDKKFWLMVEAGDVDWANHANNIDNSIGAVKSGDQAIRVITEWVDQHSNWNDSLMIVTADHGHYLIIEQPELLLDTQPVAASAKP